MYVSGEDKPQFLNKILAVTIWVSMDAICEFAGDNP